MKTLYLNKEWVINMLHYRMYPNEKSNEWVTLVHGAGGSSSIWYKQIRTFKDRLNVLCIDLRGHGKSSEVKWKRGDNFYQVSEDIIEVLDDLGIKSSHFVGISLGTIVIQTLTRNHPDRVKSMVLGGAVVELNFRTKLLIAVGNLFKYLVPYLWLYKVFAWIIMPKSNHAESRTAFVTQAKKMCQKEFIRWFRLTNKLNPFLKRLQIVTHQIPTLFIMGAEDHLFIPSIKDLVLKQPELKLACLEDCGHVCNLEKPIEFNRLTLSFISENC